MRFRERELAVVLYARITLTMVVIHFIGIEPVEQALEMIETMPIMSADCGIERGAELSPVFFVVERVEECFALTQYFRDGCDQRRFFHIYAPMRGSLRCCKKCIITLQTATARERPKSKPPSSM